jgi:hypothetical protein
MPANRSGFSNNVEEMGEPRGTLTTNLRLRSMKLWPIDSYEIETPLTVAEVVVRLQRITVPNRSLRRAAGRSFFVGRVTDSAFELRPVIYSFTSFLPELHGSFELRPGGTAVRVEMVPGRATLTILAVVVAFLAMSVYDHDARRVLLTTAGYVILGWVTSMAGFWLDADRARQKLCAVLSPLANSSDAAKDPSQSDAGAI